MFAVEINGQPATVDDLSTLAFAGYGHFTSMQVRNHRLAIASHSRLSYR